MTRLRILFAAGAVACLFGLIWWVPWCFHALRGWTAAPLGWTVSLILYAGMAGGAMLAMRGKI